jgi:hypothetical protein
LRKHAPTGDGDHFSSLHVSAALTGAGKSGVLALLSGAEGGSGGW